jgi:hypothetical protein
MNFELLTESKMSLYPLKISLLGSNLDHLNTVDII